MNQNITTNNEGNEKRSQSPTIKIKTTPPEKPKT